jgi:hypothetical protein
VDEAIPLLTIVGDFVTSTTSTSVSNAVDES